MRSFKHLIIFCIFCILSLQLFFVEKRYSWETPTSIFRASGEKDFVDQIVPDHLRRLNNISASFVNWGEPPIRKLLKTPLPNITLLQAYEYENEYGISVSTPGIKQGSLVYCRYIDKNGLEIGKAFESFIFPESVITCPKRHFTKKIAITTKATGELEPAMILLDRTMKEPKYELSICLSPMYGKEPKWLQLIEFIEHYKLQGATRFYIYVYEISEYDALVLNDYVRTGDVEVFYFLERDKRPEREWHHVMVNECLLRSRAESKWSAFVDIDERLHMTNSSYGTLLDYLRTIKEEKKVASLIFRQRWIFKTELMPEKYQGEAHLLQWMPTLRWHNTSAPGPPKHTTKCILDPKKVMSMSVHHPVFTARGYQHLQLLPEQGIVRHYRDLTMWDWGKKWMGEVLRFGKPKKTNYPSKFGMKLIRNVMERAKYVYANAKF